MRRFRVAAITVGWQPQDFSRTLGAVERWLDELGVEVAARIAVANRSTVRVPPGFVAVEGSNRGLDLGGYAEGLLQLRDLDVAPDAVLLVNDRLMIYESDRPVLARMDAGAIRRLRGTTSAIGHLWSWRRPDGSPAHRRHWLQSHCVLISTGALERLSLPALLMDHGRGSIRLRGGRFSVEGDASGDLAAFLDEWWRVRGRPGHPGPRAGSDPFESDDFSPVVAKAETVLRELRLSSEILRLGGTLLDTRGLGVPWLDRRRIASGGGIVWTAGSPNRSITRRVAGRLRADAGAAAARLSRL